MGLIVADFSVHASVPSTELCLEDTVANTKGKRIKGEGQNQRWPTSGQGGYITPAAWGSPPPQSGGQNQRWPTSGQGGYITPAAWGVPTASERGAESEVAHKWARWLHNPCRLGGPHRLRAGGRIRGGPQVGKVAT